MWAERVTNAIERSSVFDTIGGTLGDLVNRAVPPGRVKDLLAGTWYGHPLHPMLTDVTIGAWGSAMVLDISPGTDTEAGARRLIAAGIGASLPTAASGLSELADIVDAGPRRVAAAHALANVAAVVFYTGSYAARRRDSHGAGRTLSAAGTAMLIASGFLGSHLSYRQAVGVNQTAHLDGPTEWTAVADDTDVPEGTLRRIRVNDVDVALYRERGRLWAIADRCSHRGGPLHQGSTPDRSVRCPWHGSVFSMADGTVLRGPATAPQPAYEARVNAGSIEIRARR